MIEEEECETLAGHKKAGIVFGLNDEFIVYYGFKSPMVFVICNDFLTFSHLCFNSYDWW